MPYNNREEMLADFQNKFPFAIIDWKVGKENNGDGTSVDKMLEIRDFLKSVWSDAQSARDGKWRLAITHLSSDARKSVLATLDELTK